MYLPPSYPYNRGETTKEITPKIHRTDNFVFEMGPMKSQYIKNSASQGPCYCCSKPTWNQLVVPYRPATKSPRHEVKQAYTVSICGACVKVHGIDVETEG